MSLDVSVILPTHNPHSGRLVRALAGLQGQALHRERWELLIVDNGSTDPGVFERFDWRWQPRARVIREEKLGLTHARLAGFREAVGRVLVLVDDDNVLAPDYLAEVWSAFTVHPQIGAAGGKSLPEFEVEPPSWAHEFAGCLALRHLGDKELISCHVGRKAYPDCAPLGAGMALRREVAELYVRAVEDQSRPLLDRCGGQLTSGGDNDLVLTALEGGWEVGYFPQLRLTHLIPAGRLTRDYLARLNEGIARSWLQVLDRHGIRPWPPIARWSVGLRKARAYWRCRAWRGQAEYVRWKRACGQFEGQAALGGECA